MPASRCTRAHLSRSPARRARKSSLLLPSGSPRAAAGLWLRGDETPTLEEDALAALRLAEVGFVSQFHFLLPEFSALENVTLPMQRLGRLPQPEIAARAAELLPASVWRGKRKSWPRQLSGGQSQRVAIARARQQSVADPGRPTGRQPRYRRQRQRAKDPDGPRMLLWPRRGRRHP